MYSPTFIRNVISRYLDEAKGTVSSGELRIPCPAHGDTSPSFSINLSTGLYKCFVPTCKLYKGGNIQHFVAVLDDIPVSEAKSRLDEDFKKAYPTRKRRAVKNFPYTQEHIDERREFLLSSKKILDKIKEKCLWTEETIRKYDIGYDENTGRVWIPIKEDGAILNIRMYSPFSKNNKYTSVAGFGTVSLFPIENARSDEQDVFIMEGEKDCILANQLGLHAVTSTGGAGSWRTEWKRVLAGKRVFFCYDRDKAGTEGAEKAAKTLIHIAKLVRVVNLDLDEKGADFTDYIKAGNTVQDFMKLVEKGDTYSPESDAVVNVGDEIFDATLDQIDKRRLFYKRTRTKVRVIGTESSPFIIPKCMNVSCNIDNGNTCLGCRVGDHGGCSDVMISETTPRILDLIECGTVERTRIIKDIFAIPSCKKYKYTEPEHQSISRVSVIPAIDDIGYDEATQNQTYVERELYFLGKTLLANTDYEIETLAIPSPKDQSLVHLGYKVKYADTSIEEFEMTDDIKEELEIFQCQSKKSSTTSMQTSAQM